MTHQQVTKEDILRAAERIRPYAKRTPVMTCETFDRMVGAQLFFKCENFQKVGAFKFRGAANAVLSLTAAETACGVVTHSSGNHAQALALAARNSGVRAYIVMPDNAPRVKKEAVAGYGAEIIFCTPTQEAREQTVAAVQKKTGAVLIHPYNDTRVIAGQATAALELIEDVSPLDFIVAPVGGGGLLSGTALAAHYFSPATRVIGAEPLAADDAARSLAAGHILPSLNPVTVADGLLTSLGSLTFPVIARHVDRILTVDEQSILRNLQLVWARMKILVEPSSAVALAAIMDYPNIFSGKKVGVILSGGNADIALAG